MNADGRGSEKRRLWTVRFPRSRERKLVDVHDLGEGRLEKRFEQKVAKVAKGDGEDPRTYVRGYNRTRSGHSNRRNLNPMVFVFVLCKSTCFRKRGVASVRTLSFSWLKQD